MTSKSIGLVLDPDPTKVPSYNFLGPYMSEKVGDRHTYKQTDRKTDRHIDRTYHSKVSHFVWATIIIGASH